MKDLAIKIKILDQKKVSIPALSTLESAKLAQKRAFFVLEKLPVPKNVPRKSYRKSFLKQRLPYKLPTIVRSKSGDWFVKYFYELPDRPGKFKEFRVRDGVNYIQDPDQKEIEIQQLKNDIIFALQKRGHNPFEKRVSTIEKITKAKERIKSQLALMGLQQALDWYLATKGSKGKSDKTLAGYKHAVNKLIAWYGREIAINEVTIDELEQYFADSLKSGWSARTHNNNIGILTTFFNYLVAKRKLPVSPIAAGMIDTKKNTAEKNKYYDSETIALIMPLLKNNQPLRKFILWTYYSCARGTELRSLKIKHIDTKIKKITITAETGKTGEHVGKRSIPISEELMNIIKEDGLKNLSPEWYLFGKGGEPGPTPVYTHIFTEAYQKIKDKLNLDPNYTIYSYKHTRVCDLLIAGFDPIKVMHLTGHTDWGSFQKYIRDLGSVMDKQMVGPTLTLNI